MSGQIHEASGFPPFRYFAVGEQDPDTGIVTPIPDPEDDDTDPVTDDPEDDDPVTDPDAEPEEGASG